MATVREADVLDKRITAALALLPPDQRDRAQLHDVHRHAAERVASPSFDLAEHIDALTAAATIPDFDMALQRLASAKAEHNARVEVGSAVSAAVVNARWVALRAEARDVAQRVAPVAAAAIAQLVEAGRELPKDSPLDPAQVLAADAGTPWRAAHEAIGTLMTVARLSVPMSVGSAEGQLIDRARHLAAILPLLQVADVGRPLHDPLRGDVTPVIDAARHHRLARVQQFCRDTEAATEGDVLVWLAQGRWGDEISLGYEFRPTTTADRLRAAWWPMRASVDRSPQVPRSAIPQYAEPAPPAA